MRGIAKSFVSFSWAMGMFGIEQLNSLLSDEHTDNRTQRIKDAFDEVTKAAEAVLSSRTKTMYDSGNRLQQEVVDLSFDIFRSENWSPGKMLDRAADLAESSADAIRDAGKQSKPSKGKRSSTATRRARTNA